MEEYTHKVIEHFLQPRNVGQIKDPSGKATVGSPVCGDILEFHIKVNGKGVITDAKFRTFGCGAAIASGSVLTELVKGKTLEEARKLSNDAVIRALGGLPEVKIHCSVLAEEALEKAIEDYYRKRQKK
jgi:nitrogen fixation NifU-like protein